MFSFSKPDDFATSFKKPWFKLYLKITVTFILSGKLRCQMFPHSCTFPGYSSCIQADIHRRWPLSLVYSVSRSRSCCTRWSLSTTCRESMLSVSSSWNTTTSNLGASDNVTWGETENPWAAVVNLSSLIMAVLNWIQVVSTLKSISFTQWSRDLRGDLLPGFVGHVWGTRGVVMTPSCWCRGKFMRGWAERTLLPESTYFPPCIDDLGNIHWWIQWAMVGLDYTNKIYY